VLWPDHCVQGSPGAQLCDGLAIDHAILILRKGYHADIDSYSAFTEADGKTSTGLASFLREKRHRPGFRLRPRHRLLRRLVGADARANGFEAFVIDDACRAIDAMTRSVWLGQGWIRRK